jgi:hypothetical protein
MVNYCFALPILPGGLEHIKKFAQENTNTMEHDEFYQIAGISREHVWIQPAPPGSGVADLTIVSIETENPPQMFKEFATSDHQWAIKFREFAKKAYGVDISGPPLLPNENVVAWEQQKTGSTQVNVQQSTTSEVNGQKKACKPKMVKR